ncbi:MAG: hypothetical protein QOG63_601 [Thermoleophilaceae bacterium]|jgi:hypothetical protein|nr:hypothetical protein [Thermoleophilaceae bacterium]
MAADGLCVYGIARAGAKLSPPPAGIEGRPVSTLAAGPVAALVSDAPEGPVKASRRNLMAHAGVLQHAVAEACVLPMRFGMVMPDAAAVESELLGEHEERLVAQLDAFEQLVEVDLKLVSPEDEELRAILAERPDIAELRERLKGQAPDATYYERIQLGQMVAEAAEARRAAALTQVVGALEPLTVETEVSDPAHEHMLVNVAFLAERARLAELDVVVRELSTEMGESIRFKYVGPLPPYHFVETAPAAGSASWA